MIFDELGDILPIYRPVTLNKFFFIHNRASVQYLFWTFILVVIIWLGGWYIVVDLFSGYGEIFLIFIKS